MRQRGPKRRSGWPRHSRGSQIHGLRTNRELLVRILRHPQFLAGATDTHFLERHPPADLAGRLCDEYGSDCTPPRQRLPRKPRAVRRRPSWRRFLQAGETTPRSLSRRDSSGAYGEIHIGYRWVREQLQLSLDGEACQDARIGSCSPERVQLEVDRVMRTYDVHRVDDTVLCGQPLGVVGAGELPRFPLAEEEVQPGSLVAPLPGVVDDIKVSVGDCVLAGDVLLVLESMKMLYPVTAPQAGRVAELRVQKKSHVEARTVLVVIEGLSTRRPATCGIVFGRPQIEAAPGPAAGGAKEPFRSLPCVVLPHVP